MQDYCIQCKQYFKAIFCIKVKKHPINNVFSGDWVLCRGERQLQEAVNVDKNTKKNL